MPQVIIESEVGAPIGAGTSDRGRWLVWLAAGALWFFLVYQLGRQWSVSAQYAYGWAVPLLALYLFGERWKSRPEPEPARSFVVALFAGALVAGLLPLRLIEEANPDWRLIAWLMSLAVAGATLGALHRAGGWPWVRHFAFPVCFILIAIPWPTNLEDAIIQNLMRNVSAACVEMLGWAGIAATQHGNLIETARGTVGVEEACSGVRSLQTCLMAALFLGELFRFTIVRRLLVVAAGLGIAYGCNLARTFALVLLEARGSAGAMERWHDTIGLVALVLAFALLVVAANFLRRETAAPPRSDAQKRGARAPGAVVLWSVIGWLVFSELLTEAWYRAHEQPIASAENWTLRWPVPARDFTESALPAATRALLRCDESRVGNWSDEAGRRWSLIYLRWFPGRTASLLAKAHVPEICMTAGGNSMQADLGVQNRQVGALVFPVRSYIFTGRGQLLHLFFAFVEEGVAAGSEAGRFHATTRRNRLLAVREGRRNRGQRVLEVAITGAQDQAEAEKAYVSVLPTLITHETDRPNGPAH